MHSNTTRAVTPPPPALLAPQELGRQHKPPATSKPPSPFPAAALCFTLQFASKSRPESKLNSAQVLTHSPLVGGISFCWGIPAAPTLPKASQALFAKFPTMLLVTPPPAFLRVNSKYVFQDLFALTSKTQQQTPLLQHPAPAAPCPHLPPHPPPAPNPIRSRVPK